MDPSEYRAAIGYENDQSIASPQQQVLFQNEDKSVIYQVTYLPDTTAEDAAAKFGANAEKTTWEQAIWEYHRFCYENSSEEITDIVVSHSPDYDLTLWKFAADNTENDSTTETLFCDRADGCYSIAMTYPTKDTAAKIALYTIVEDLSFQTDIDRLEKIRNNIDFDWEINENGDLVITATNTGDETAEYVDFSVDRIMIDEDGAECHASYISKSKTLLPGETATFTVSAEDMKDVVDYTVEPNVFFLSRMIELDGTVQNLN